MRNFKVVRFRNWSRLGKNMLDGGQFVWVRKKRERENSHHISRKI